MSSQDNNPESDASDFLHLRGPCAILTVCWLLDSPHLLAAYERRIFPWYSPGDAILFPAEFHISRSLKRFLRSNPFRITPNHDFAIVVAAYAHRPDDGTWIGEEVQRAYLQLHHIGLAHSVEVWLDDELVGGMYGVAQGALFCGESMFSRTTNASKCGLMAFCHHFTAYGGELVDCQGLNAHTATLGVGVGVGARKLNL